MSRYAAFLGVFLFASPAMADKDVCISAYEQTQTLRKDGKLVLARQQSAICSKDNCPAILAKDCTKWTSELDASTPSILVEAKNASGAEITDVHVKIDNVAITEKLDGKPIPLDPGSRVLHFEADGYVPVEKTLSFKEGERSRKVSFVFAPAAATAKADEGGARPIPTAAWVFGGVAVAAFATSAVFAIDGLGKKSDLDAFKPHCNADDVDSMSTRFTFADVALGAGVVAAAASLYLFFSRPAQTGVKESKDAGLRLSPGGVSGRF